MRKGRDFLDKPVIEINSGKLLGYVNGFKPGQDGKLAGIYMKDLQKKPLLIPFEKVSNLGRDAVLVNGHIYPQELETNQAETKYEGTLVMTASGNNMGTIQDLVFDEEDGSITGYEVSDGLLMDIVAGRKIVSATNVLSFQNEAVIIGDIHLD